MIKCVFKYIFSVVWFKSTNNMSQIKPEMSQFCVCNLLANFLSTANCAWFLNAQ